MGGVVSGTTVPAAISALLATWTPVPGVTVIDGEPYESPPDVFLCVAWDRSGQPSIVRAANSYTSMAATQNDESFDVSCLLSLWDGDKTPPQMREAIFALFSALDAAVTADHTLGGVVLLSRIADYEFTPARRIEGSAAEIRFTVTNHAWS